MKVGDLTHFMTWLVDDANDVYPYQLIDATEREAIARRYVDQHKTKVRRSMGVLEEPHLAKP